MFAPAKVLALVGQQVTGIKQTALQPVDEYALKVSGPFTSLPSKANRTTPANQPPETFARGRLASRSRYSRAALPPPSKRSSRCSKTMHARLQPPAIAQKSMQHKPRTGHPRPAVIHKKKVPCCCVYNSAYAQPQIRAPAFRKCWARLKPRTPNRSSTSESARKPGRSRRRTASTDADTSSRLMQTLL